MAEPTAEGVPGVIVPYATAIGLIIQGYGHDSLSDVRGGRIARLWQKVKFGLSIICKLDILALPK